MIACFMGVPGSGKSYDAVRRVIENLKKGRTVYTNIEGMDETEHQECIRLICGLDEYEFSQRFHFLSEHEAARFWDNVKPEAFIVIDEIHNLFNARNWQSQNNVDFSRWASTHRHHGFDLLMLTQDLEKVDKQVRSSTSWTYEFRKNDFMGRIAENSYTCYAFFGDDTKGKSISTKVRRYDSKIFLCYKSYVSKEIKEQKFMAHVNILKRPLFYAIPVVLCFFLYMFFGRSTFASGNFLGAKTVKTGKTSEIKKPSGVSRKLGKWNIIEYNYKDKVVSSRSNSSVLFGRDLDRENVSPIKRGVGTGIPPVILPVTDKQTVAKEISCTRPVDVINPDNSHVVIEVCGNEERKYKNDALISTKKVVFANR